MFGIRTNFIPSPFSARYEFVLPKEVEPTPPPIQEQFPNEPLMLEKQNIVETRQKKLQNKKTKNKGLPGQKLLKQLAKKQQLEDSITRVVKHLDKSFAEHLKLKNSGL